MGTQSKPLYVVYSVGSTMEQDKTYKSRYAADQLASKLQAGAAKRGFAANTAIEHLMAEKVAIAAAGDPHKSLPKIDALIAQLETGALYAVATVEDYHAKVVYQSLQTNMMSKKEYWEASNTPVYCSPAHESYWSM